MSAVLLVMAKSPRAGRTKTRLCPPCTPEEAAAIAEASLMQTIENAIAVDGLRVVLVIDGSAPVWLPAGFEVIPQRGSDLGERLASAFADSAGPALAIGMDTPQVTPGLLREAFDTLLSPGVEAVIGDARDGGYWAIGLRRAEPSVFEGVPMSSPHTCREQRRRLAELGMTTADLPMLTDVDSMTEAEEVAAQIPGTRFAELVRQVMRRRYANVH